MPFAGQIRLKTFIMGVAGAVGLGGGGALIALQSGEGEPAPTEVTTVHPVPTPPLEKPVPPPAPVVASVEQALLELAGQDLGTSKKKDLFSGRAYKVNAYQDEGHATVNRAKVDLDRDEQWDEKWTFAGDGITRQVSPDDDGQYPVEQRYTPKGERITAVVDPVPGDGPTKELASAEISAHEQVAMGFLGKDLGTKKKKDVSKGRAFKINVYQDDGNPTANRLKIDLDRDDRWDEKWTFDGDTVSRKVAPADDEQYSVEQVWTGSAWK